MIELAAHNREDARIEMKRISKQHPGKYCVPCACFGIFLHVLGKLHVNAPSDTPIGLKFYYLNGVEKPFTEAQRIACQQATPALI